MAVAKAVFQDPAQQKEADLKRAAKAGFIGNFAEWFDYGVYAYLSVVIASVFFPEIDRATAVMATYAVLAASYLIRPVGGIFWGYIGDQFGRRMALAWSVILMSLATFLMALLPGYASIGAFAPMLLLLLRMMQGFSVSGEYAGAAVYLAEHAPPEKRGFYAGLIPISAAAGLLAASLMAAGLQAVLSGAAMVEWGWRIPFLLAAPFGLIGLYMRRKLEDSPAFRSVRSRIDYDRFPFIRIFLEHPKATVVAFLVACLNAVAFYLILSYIPDYLSEEMGISKSESFIAASVSLFAYIFFVLVSSRLSDKYGRRNMLIAASVLFAVLTVPLFMAFGMGGFVLILPVQLAFGAMLSVNDGVIPAYLAELFPTEMRYTGFAFTFNSANALMGGTTPLIATWLIAVSGSKISPAWYLMAMAVLTIPAVLSIRDKSRESLH